MKQLFTTILILLSGLCFGQDYVLDNLTNTKGISKLKVIQDSLKVAIYRKDTVLILQLVNRGADLNYKTNNGFYPLYDAVINDNERDNDSSIYWFLQKHGAKDFNLIYQPFLKACEQGKMKDVKEYINNGIDINASRIWYDPSEMDPGCDCYESAINYCIKSGSLPLVKFMVQNGAKIRFDMNGVQPLYTALSLRNYEIADYLLKIGADKEGLFALSENFYDMVGVSDTTLLNYLVENDFECSSLNYNSAFNKAVQNNNIYFVLQYVKVVKWVQQFSEAFCYCTSKEIAEILIDNGADVNYVHMKIGEGGCHFMISPLNIAVKEGDKEYVSYLLEKGTDINVYDQYMKGKSYMNCEPVSPLMTAINMKNVEMLKFLLKNGANPNYYYKLRYEEGYCSVLMKAVQTNNIRIVELLLKKGALLIVEGQSIFDLVSEKTDPDIVKLLNKY